MKQGYVSIILHSHLPFIRHPDVMDALEERWLFEAMHECYIPIINAFDNLASEKINFKITMSITPPLMSMLEDEYLNERFHTHLKGLIELSEKEIDRNRNNKELYTLAQFYNMRFLRELELYNQYDNNLMNAFRKYDRLGNLEVITCSATHALLPLSMINPGAVRAQIAAAVQHYTNMIGHSPSGIWLPECAYYYGIDKILKEFGINYFICENTGVLNASPRPQYGTLTPIATPNGVCAFPRDSESSCQVWSNFFGYPGDYNYREFYRDIGYELPLSYIGPYINKSGIKVDTGIKYYKVTGKTENKEYYNRAAALSVVKSHSQHFMHSRKKQIALASVNMERPPIIVCPYDTELFGHWWFEGPEFIEDFIKKSSVGNDVYELTTPSEYLRQNPIVQCSTPTPSSWGENGDFSVWLNPSTHWIYRELHMCQEKMISLANTYSNPDENEKRMLNQAARELMLAESSDWPFMIKQNTTVAYGVKRVKAHIDNFNKLYELLSSKKLDNGFIKKLETVNNIFSNINYLIYKTKTD